MSATAISERARAGEPATVDATRVDASFQDGVLTVKLPRREEARPRQIPING